MQGRGGEREEMKGKEIEREERGEIKERKGVGRSSK